MKKFILLILLAAIVLASCEKEPKKEEVVVKEIELSEEHLVLQPNESVLLTAEVYAETLDDVVVTWSSSDAKVATVKEGKVTAVAIGNATVTASVGEVKTTCTVEVLGSPKINDFYYSDGSWSTTLNKNKACVGIVYAVNFDRSSMRNPVATLENPFPPYVRDPNKPDLKNLVVGLHDLGDLTAWDKSSSYGKLKTNALNWFNGDENTSTVAKLPLSDIEILPPFLLVLKEQTPDLNWYLPSACELLELICVFNGQPSWVLGPTKSFPFGENITEEQMFAAFQTQRNAFNARLVEAGGGKINDVQSVLKDYPNVPTYTGDVNDKDAYEKWDKEIWEPWIEANPGYYEALQDQTSNLAYWSSTSMEKYAPDKDYFTSAISFSSVNPNFQIFPFKSNLHRVRPILAF